MSFSEFSPGLNTPHQMALPFRTAFRKGLDNSKVSGENIAQHINLVHYRPVVENSFIDFLFCALHRCLAFTSGAWWLILISEMAATICQMNGTDPPLARLAFLTVSLLPAF